MTVVVTGGGGYIGRQVVAALAAEGGGVVSMDIRLPESEEQLDGVTYEVMDIRSDQLTPALVRYGASAVVHLAAIVSPGKNPNREREHAIDVLGTKNVLEACLSAGVTQVIVSSSGAAYGYWPDNPDWIDEGDALRGNEVFAYSDHKRLVEEMLAEWREHSPELNQLILRSGTVLGTSTRNQITDLFDRKVLFGPGRKPIPFVFIWDQDVVNIILQGIRTRASGIYNLAGDGAVSLRELARRMEKRFISIPVWLVKAVLGLLHPLKLSQYGPEQVDFLRFRPVLSNARLKDEFGYQPTYTSSEVFDLFWAARG